MKTYLLILVLFAGSLKGYSQSVYELRGTMDLFRANKMASGDWMKSLSESEIEGSPYFNDEFLKGTVYTTSKTKYEDVDLRYNIYNNQLEFKTPDGQVQGLATPEIIEFVELGGYKFVYAPYYVSKKISQGFFQIIEEGKATLYSRAEVTFKKAEEPGAYKEAEPAKFVRKPDIYYIRVGKDAAVRISRKKDLLEVFPDFKKEIAAFIKKNKVKPNKTDKLKELVQYYNSL